MVRQLREALARQVRDDLEMAHCEILDRDAHASQVLVGHRRKPQLIALA